MTSTLKTKAQNSKQYVFPGILYWLLKSLTLTTQRLICMVDLSVISMQQAQMPFYLLSCVWQVT